MSVSPRQINRILNLTFKVTGIREQSEEVNKLLTAMSMAIRLIITLRIMATLLETEHPWLALLTGGLTLGSIITSDLGRLFDTSGAR